MSDRRALSAGIINAATLVAALFVPLLVKLRLVQLPEVFALAGYPNPIIDGFSWYKGIALIFAAALALSGILLQKRYFKLSDSLFLGIAFLAVASAALSPYRSLTIWGVPFIFEGLPASLSYLILGMGASRLEERVTSRTLPYGLALASLIITSVGLLELSGRQLINESFLANLLLTIDERIYPYSGGFAGASVPFGNPNYVGLYAAMIWPFFLILSLTRRTFKESLLFIVASLASFALLLASMSRGGLIGALISISLAIFVIRKERSKVWLLIALVFAHGGSYYAMDSLSNRKTSERVATVPPQFSMDSFRAPTPESLGTSPSAETEISKVQIEAGRLKMEGRGPLGPWMLRIERQYQSIKFMDESFRPLPFAVGGDKPEEREKVQILDPRYNSLSMALHDAGVFRVLSINAIDVAITNWGFRIGKAGAFVTPVVAERFPLPIADETFSFRGFIWSYSLPLLKKTLLLGQGAGSFPFEFPNNDPVKMSAVFGPDSLVDKPHNFFISFAHTHGLLALLLFLALLLINTSRTLQMITSEGPTKIATYLPYLAGVCGYLICALTADSSIGVSAIFWVMFGILAQNSGIKASKYR